MRTEQGARRDALGAPREVAPAEVPALARFGWLLRRELWESRSIYLAPLAVTGLVLVGAVVGAFRVPARMRELAALEPAAQHEALTEPYLMASLLLMGTTFVVGLIYCLAALQSERRDRSILFWKSLPVSDAVTVLAKATVPLVILPVLTVVLAAIAHLVMLLLGSAASIASGRSPGALWAHVSLLGMWRELVHHMVAVHVLWYAPIYGWLLLVSVWARRAPWLWAILPPLAIAIVERIAFGSSRFADLLTARISGVPLGTEATVAGGTTVPLMPMTPGSFLSAPGLWVGLLLTALCLGAAVRLRRRRGPV